MRVACKIDHETTFPAFLCRACHPELELTPEAKAIRVHAERAALKAQQNVSRLRSELLSADERVKGYIKRGWPEEGSVGDKVATALRKKAERLRSELAQLDNNP